MRKNILFACFFLCLGLSLLAQNKTKSVLVYGVVHSYVKAQSIPNVSMKIQKDILFFTVYKKFSTTSDLGGFSFNVSVDSFNRLPKPLIVKFCKKGYEPSRLTLTTIGSPGYLVYMTAKKQSKKTQKKRE